MLTPGERERLSQLERQNPSTRSAAETADLDGLRGRDNPPGHVAPIQQRSIGRIPDPPPASEPRHAPKAPHAIGRGSNVPE